MIAKSKRRSRRFNKRGGKTVGKVITREIDPLRQQVLQTCDTQFYTRRIRERYEARGFYIMWDFNADMETKRGYNIYLVYDVRNVVQGRYRLVQIVVDGRRIKHPNEIERLLPGYTIKQAERSFWVWYCK